MRNREDPCRCPASEARDDWEEDSRADSNFKKTMNEPFYDPSERPEEVTREEFEDAMAPRHTPGPWGMSKHIEIWIKAGPIHVATIPRALDGDWSEANARLIAAAPDLLEAMQEIAKQQLTEEMDDHAAEGADYEGGYEAIVKIARAAYAKAAGKEPR